MNKNDYNKERLLLQAMQIFIDKGIADTMLVDIAEATGIPLYIILDLFQNKREIFEECVRFAQSISACQSSFSVLIEENRELISEFEEKRKCQKKYIHTGLNPFMPISFL